MTEKDTDFSRWGSDLDKSLKCPWIVPIWRGWCFSAYPVLDIMAAIQWFSMERGGEIWSPMWDLHRDWKNIFKWYYNSMFGKLTLFYNKNYIQLGLKPSQLVQIHRTTIILKGHKVLGWDAAESLKGCVLFLWSSQRKSEWKENKQTNKKHYIIGLLYSPWPCPLSQIDSSNQS